MANDPRLLLATFDFCAWLLQRTAGFPKRFRSSLTSRVEMNAIELLEHVTAARYASEPGGWLSSASLALDRLRLLLRLAHAVRALDTSAYERSTESLVEVGRMLGGWLRHANTDEVDS